MKTIKKAAKNIKVYDIIKSYNPTLYPVNLRESFNVLNEIKYNGKLNDYMIKHDNKLFWQCTPEFKLEIVQL
jgi:hypothetical protein